MLLLMQQQSGINLHAVRDSNSCKCAERAEFCENLLQSAGVRFAGPIAILRNWTFCLFYVMAELWGSVVVSLLFWGFANQVYSFQCMSQLACKVASYLQSLQYDSNSDSST